MQQVLIWDFDWSLVDNNTDPWVINKLGASQVFNGILKQRKEFGWTKCIDLTLKTAHEHFKYTKQQVQEACWSVPIHPSIVNVVKDLIEDAETTQYIVSDANTIFIESILRHHDMQDAFRGIYTNKAWFDEDGAMRIGPFLDQAHDCPLCPSNLCKGEVLEMLLKEQSFDRVIYVGDGSGDFCPCSKLNSGDIILARAHYPNKTSKCPLLQKLEDSGIGRFQNGITAGHEKTVQSNDNHPRVLAWKDQPSLAQFLCSLKRN